MLCGVTSRERRAVFEIWKSCSTSFYGWISLVAFAVLCTPQVAGPQASRKFLPLLPFATGRLGIQICAITSGFFAWVPGVERRS